MSVYLGYILCAAAVVIATATLGLMLAYRARAGRLRADIPSGACPIAYWTPLVVLTAVAAGGYLTGSNDPAWMILVPIGFLLRYLLYYVIDVRRLLRDSDRLSSDRT